MNLNMMFTVFIVNILFITNTNMMFMMNMMNIMFKFMTKYILRRNVIGQLALRPVGAVGVVHAGRRHHHPSAVLVD